MVAIVFSILRSAFTLYEVAVALRSLPKIRIPQTCYQDFNAVNHALALIQCASVSSASDLLLSKMNLAGWLHPHFALTCPEAIQRLVIERDNFFRRQGSAILGSVSIAGQQHVVALSNSPADCCIDTILCLAPGDDHAFDTVRFQLFLQTRLMKRIG